MLVLTNGGPGFLVIEGNSPSDVAILLGEENSRRSQAIYVRVKSLLSCEGQEAFSPSVF